MPNHLICTRSDDRKEKGLCRSIRTKFVGVGKHRPVPSILPLLMPRVFTALHNLFGTRSYGSFLSCYSKSILSRLRFDRSPSVRSNSFSFRTLPVRSQHSSADAWPYIYSPKTDKMAPQLDSYFKQVDALSENFIDRLRKAVAIPSVSAEDERRGDVVKVGCS